MLAPLQVVVLALLQGITEFLPVSSSAHLILIPAFFAWPDQGLAFDIAVHLGTLLAVMSYFRADIFKIVVDFIHSIKERRINSHQKLGWLIIVATIPVGLVGFFARNFIENHLRSPSIIAWTTLGFGILLWIADYYGRKKRTVSQLTWQEAIIIGGSQALSLIPGTSRSGITLTAGLFLGLTRENAAHFSFLLSIPVIILAGGLETIKLLKNPISVNWVSLGWGVGLSAISGYCCIHYFLKLLNKIGLAPFVLYRLILGISLLMWKG